jgi:hypothetical protein
MVAGATPPTMPPKGPIVRGPGNVKIVNDFGGTQPGQGVPMEHGPAHLHVEGGGPNTSIGQNGQPLEGCPELTNAQKKVVEENKSLIRRTVGKIGRCLAAAAAAIGEATEIMIIIIPMPGSLIDPSPDDPLHRTPPGGWS